ncbi:MAG: hypothetical protein VZR10_08045 [Methanobrevibacter sp.]|nr:hypothetical protein [Methanobrevibacter sp.]
MIFLPRPETMSIVGLVFGGLILLIGDNPVFWTGLFISTLMMVLGFCLITVPEGNSNRF